MRSLHPLLVAVATLLAAFLRARGLSDFAITHWDEGLVWRGARYFASLGSEGHYSPSHGPPLVALVAGALQRLVGAGPGLVAGCNVALSAACVPLAYAVARQLASPRAGLVAAFLVATSGLHAMFARSLLTETTYAFFLLAVLALGLRALDRGRTAWFLATGVAVACAQATKYNGFLAAVPFCALLVLRLLRAPEELDLSTLLARLACLVLPAAAVIAANLVAIAVVADLGAFVEHYSAYVGVAGDPREILGTLAWTTPWAVLALAPVGLLLHPRGRERALLLHLFAALYVAFLARYAFYLRLCLPVVTLLALYAAVGVDGLARRLPRPAGAALALLLVALAGAQEWQRRGRFYMERFDGYRVAARWLQGQPLSPGRARLFASQDFVWQDLGPEVPVFGLPSEGASGILAGCEEVELVVDIGAFSRLRPWDLTPIYPTLREHFLIERFPATLNLDVLQNNLTLDELRALGEDPDLDERVLWIHVFRLPSRELERLIAQ